MKKFLFFIFITSISISGYSQENNRTNIRGQVISVDGKYGEYSLSSVYVDLYWYNGKEWVTIDRAITDQDGYYFFYNVYPGEYFIQVNGSKNYKISVYRIDPKYQFQDLPKLYY